MAKVKNGSFNTTGYEGRCLTFEWWVNSQNLETNKTNIGYKLYGAGGQSGIYYRAGNFKLIINGSEIYKSATRIDLLQGTIVTSGNLDIEHTSDGSKAFSAYAEAGIYYTAVNCTGSGSWELPDIPRASKVTGGSGNIGEATTITINRAVESFTHTLKYEFGSLTGTIATNVATSYKWTIPTSFYGQVIAQKEGKGKIICETYNGAVLTGTSETEFTAKVVNSNPVVGTFTYKDNNSVTTAITKDNQRIIRNNSTLLFTIGTATAKNSATISKYEVTFNERTLTRTSNGTLDFGIINLSSNSKAILKVTDSRGFTTSKEIEVIIDDWEIPKGIVSAKRKNNFYSETILKVDGTYSDLNGKNSLAIQYICRRMDLKESSYDGNLEDNKESIVTLDNNYQWHIQFFISDRLGQSTYNVYIDRGMPLIFFDRLSNAVGINKFPSGGFKLDIEGNTRGTNLPIATGLNNIKSFDDVGEGGQLFKSGLYSVVIDNVWYHLLNIRHRNGLTDGTLYGLQIRNRFTIGYPLEYRQQNNGTWTEWKDFSGTSYAQMWTNGQPSLSTQTKVNIWTGGSKIEGGSFVCDQANGRIKIPAGSAKVVEIYGTCAGGGYALIDLRLSDGTTTFQSRTISQVAGNTYWSSPLSSMLVSIPDTTKDWYLEMYAGGYNSTYLMNSGFGAGSSFMGVKKVS